MDRWPRRCAHGLLGLAMVAMAWPAMPGWLSLAMVVPPGALFLGLAALRRRPADVHHALMAACMAWMAAMPPMHHVHSGGAGVAASYFLLAAAPFLTAPWRTRPRGPVLGPLGHAAMSLTMAAFLTTHG